jgi:multidrug efflux system membrane fusion protein
MPRRASIVLGLIVLAGAGGGYYWTTHHTTPAPQAAERAAAGRGQPAVVMTATATSDRFIKHRRTIGWIEPVAQVAVKARLDSQIATQAVSDGQHVAAGDLLFTLDDREVKAQLAKDQAALDRDLAQQKKVQADLERAKELQSRGAASAQALDQSTADAAVAAAAVEADRAAIGLDQTRLGYTRITAPIGGRLGSVTVTPGNVVHANNTGPGLVTITQVAPLRVAFPLPERDLATVKTRLAAGSAPQVRVFRAGETKPLAEGAVTFLDSAVTTASGTITAKAQFDNADETLWPGMAVDVEVETDIYPDAITVPTVAVQSGQSGPFVFTVGADQTVDVKPVTIVASEGDRTAVSGLDKDAVVVTDGQARLAKGVKVRLGGGSAGAKPAQPAKVS